MSISHKAVGRRLRTAREEQKISRKDAAQAIGISSILLSRIETGKSTMTIEMLSKICAYFGVSESEILWGIDLPINIELDSRFRDVVSSCSESTVDTILEVCRIIAKVEESVRKES